MLRDITIGQYYMVDSVIHALDARLKLIAVFLYIATLFAFGNLVSYLLATVMLAVCIGISKVPLKFVIRGLKPLAMLLIFTSVLNLIMTPGDVVLKIWKITITREGIFLAIHIAVRLVYLIIFSSLLTLTTTPTMITDALESILRPLNKLKIPVHEIAMMMSIALRFIPILVDEAEKIMNAQYARCMDFKDSNLIKRVKNLVSLVIPIFVSAARRANDLALAMESRCYRGSYGRTKMKIMKYEKRDYIAYVILLLYFAISFTIHLYIK